MKPVATPWNFRASHDIGKSPQEVRTSHENLKTSGDNPRYSQMKVNTGLSNGQSSSFVIGSPPKSPRNSSFFRPGVIYQNEVPSPPASIATPEVPSSEYMMIPNSEDESVDVALTKGFKNQVS